MALHFSDILSNETIEWILTLPEVIHAKETINSKNQGSYDFSISLSPSIKTHIFNLMGLDLSNISSVPMRWIKGDTPPHHDNGESNFTHTYLIYLSDSYGKLVVDGLQYPIQRGSGYIFAESLSHETIDTNADIEPRLLLGPMSEYGFVVGGANSPLQLPGGTTLYLRQLAVGQPISYSTNMTSWNSVVWPLQIQNSNTALGFVTIEFITDIKIDSDIGGSNAYIICSSDNIQIGSRNLKSNGTRPIITVDTIHHYAGLVQNGISGGVSGYSNIYIMNLEVRASGGAHLVNGGGWFGQTYFGTGTATSNNVILNCISTGDISNYSGGIVGQYTGPVKLVSCSSSGAISQFGGGIVGGNSPSTAGLLRCESCWSSGVIGHFGGGITGQSTGGATIVNCFSTGAITENAGGISGRYTGGTGGGNDYNVSECYSTGPISDRAGGILGSDLGVVTVSNCYSRGAVAVSGGGIIGTVPVENATHKYISYCYTTGVTAHTHGYIVPGYTNVNTNFTVGTGTIYISNNYSEAANASSGWNNTRANTVLQGVPASSTAPIGVKWVYAGANTPYELYAMGYTPYARTTVNGSPPAMVRSFTTYLAPGSSTPNAIISGKSYTILHFAGGVPSSYASITMNSSTGAIMTSTGTAAGTYTLTLRNNGSYHITTYTLIVNDRRYFSLYGTYTDNAQVYYKSHSHPSGGIGTVRNCRKKARKT